MDYPTDQERKADAGAFHDALKELAPKVFRLTLKGHIPAKKNLMNPGVNRRTGKLMFFADEEVKAQIEALVLQAKQQWQRIPAIDPDVDVELFVTHQGADRDNKLTTILDVLRDAGVIANDNIKQFNGTVVILPALVGKVEGVVIDVSEKQQILE